VGTRYEELAEARLVTAPTHQGIRLRAGDGEGEVFFWTRQGSEVLDRLEEHGYLLAGPLTRFQTHHPFALLVLVLRSELALHGACLVPPGSSSQPPNPWEWPPGQGWRSHRAAAPGRAALRRVAASWTLGSEEDDSVQHWNACRVIVTDLRSCLAAAALGILQCAVSSDELRVRVWSVVSGPFVPKLVAQDKDLRDLPCLVALGQSEPRGRPRDQEEDEPQAPVPWRPSGCPAVRAGAQRGA
jgi:hypothetical protein